MKVEGPNPLRPGAVRRKGAPGATDSSFADALDSAEASADVPANITGASASAAVSTILALQSAEAEEGDAATARSKSRAEDMLRKLDLLRLDLLTGGIPRDHLVGLAQAVKSSRENVFDPRLNEVLDEIDLRAQVELAKYDPYR